MGTREVFASGILSMLVAVGSFDTSTTYALIVSERVESNAEAEALLDFRIQEVIERSLPSGCIVDLEAVDDERRLDPQLTSSEKGHAFVLANSSECVEPDVAMPTN
jgi:hypothetical protein